MDSTDNHIESKLESRMIGLCSQQNGTVVGKTHLSSLGQQQQSPTGNQARKRRTALAVFLILLVVFVYGSHQKSTCHGEAALEEETKVELVGGSAMPSNGDPPGALEDLFHKYLPGRYRQDVSLVRHAETRTTTTLLRLAKRDDNTTASSPSASASSSPPPSSPPPPQSPPPARTEDTTTPTVATTTKSSTSTTQQPPPNPTPTVTAVNTPPATALGTSTSPGKETRIPDPTTPTTGETPATKEPPLPSNIDGGTLVS